MTTSVAPNPWTAGYTYLWRRLSLILDQLDETTSSSPTMPKYQAIRHAGQLYLPLRYDNSAAINTPSEPSVPWSVVPLHRSINDVLSEARGLDGELVRQLTSMGVHHVDLTPRKTVGYRDKLRFPFQYFRGERTTRFGIMPTRYRFSGQLDPFALVRQRTQFELVCATRMQEYMKRHDALGIGDFENLFGSLATWSAPDYYGRDIHYRILHPMWQIPYRSFEPNNGVIKDATLTITVPQRLVGKLISIRTRLVPSVARVEAQEGLFLEVCYDDPDDWPVQVLVWTVLDFASRK